MGRGGGKETARRFNFEKQLPHSRGNAAREVFLGISGWIVTTGSLRGHIIETIKGSMKAHWANICAYHLEYTLNADCS